MIFVSQIYQKQLDTLVNPIIRAPGYSQELPAAKYNSSLVIASARLCQKSSIQSKNNGSTTMGMHTS